MRGWNPYSVLGVAEDASPAETSKAWRTLARLHHPDRNPDDAHAHARSVEINRAYEALSTPEARALTDARLRMERLEDQAQLRQASRPAASGPAPSAPQRRRRRTRVRRPSRTTRARKRAEAKCSWPTSSTAAPAAAETSSHRPAPPATTQLGPFATLGATLAAGRVPGGVFWLVLGAILDARRTR